MVRGVWRRDRMRLVAEAPLALAELCRIAAVCQNRPLLSISYAKSIRGIL